MVEVTGQKTPYYVRQSHFDNERMAGSVPAWKNNGGAQETSSPNPLSLANGQNTEVTAPSLSFGELLDVINPLHHIPVVGNVYRDLTDDKISAVASVTGGFLYGGPLGGVASLANAAVEEHTGGSLVDAVTSTSSAKTYSFEDEPRTAGMKKRAPETHKAESNNIFASFETELEPVKRVVIADNSTPAPYRRSFNS